MRLRAVALLTPSQGQPCIYKILYIVTFFMTVYIVTNIFHSIIYYAPTTNLDTHVKSFFKVEQSPIFILHE